MYLCRHATGTIDEYVEEAIRLGFDSLGMSDHAPWKALVNRSERMIGSDYPIYKKQLEAAIIKYKDKIKIYRGLEIEYFYNKEQVYKNYLKEMDYLALGQHYIEMNGKILSVYKIHTLEELTIYKDTLIEAINTGFFKFVCHPDLFLFSQKEISDDILKLCEEIVIAAKAKNIPLEINANGMRKKKVQLNDSVEYRYPRTEFFQFVKKHHARCIISSDAHKPKYLYDEALDNAIEFSKTHGLIVEEVLTFD